MKTKILFSMLLVAVLGMTKTVSAQDASKFDQNHPRRAQVNGRLKNQNERINRKEANGTMSKQEAQKLHREDHNIRKEERRDARKDGGHITKGEQKKINRQENHVSRQIKNH